MKDYSKYNNCKKLIYENLYDPPFSKIATKKIPAYSTYDSFKKSYKREENANFDINKVTGTDHPNYNHKTWAEIIKSLKRQDRLNIHCEKGENRPSIDYYTDVEYRNSSIHDPWSIVVINNEAYVTQGHHRTAISKYLSYFGVIPKIQFGLDFVEYYEVDFYEFKRFIKIKEYFTKKYPIIKDIEIEVVSKQDENDKSKFFPQYRIHIGRFYVPKENKFFDEVLIANDLNSLKKLFFKYFIKDNTIWKVNNQLLLVSMYLKKHIKKIFPNLSL